MNINKEILVNRPITEVWDVLGNQFGDAYKWARGLDHSAAHGEATLEGAVCSHRTCDVPGFGEVEEVIRKFDAKNHILAYEITKGFPGFISSGVNTWTLTEEGSNTKVVMNLEMETKGLMGVIMGPMMKMKLNKLIAGVVADLKTYAETGAPSAQKVKELAKVAKKAA